LNLVRRRQGLGTTDAEVVKRRQRSLTRLPANGVRLGLFWFVLVWFVLVWLDVFWFVLVWFVLVWFVLVWLDLFCWVCFVGFGFGLVLVKLGLVRVIKVWLANVRIG
jgi:hypothetical protein